MAFDVGLSLMDGDVLQQVTPSPYMFYVDFSATSVVAQRAGLFSDVVRTYYFL